MKKTVTSIGRLCQNCLKKRDTTRSRSIRLKMYMGPCGDSFCYASCTSPTCRPQDFTVCDECEPKVRAANGVPKKVRKKRKPPTNGPAIEEALKARIRELEAEVAAWKREYDRTQLSVGPRRNVRGWHD